MLIIYIVRNDKLNVKNPLINISIMDYKEHALSKGSEAEAAAYVYMKRNDK